LSKTLIKASLLAFSLSLSFLLLLDKATGTAITVAITAQAPTIIKEKYIGWVLINTNNLLPED
jgi:hypothetical protein